METAVAAELVEHTLANSFPLLLELSTQSQSAPEITAVHRARIMARLAILHGLAQQGPSSLRAEILVEQERTEQGVRDRQPRALAIVFRKAATAQQAQEP